MVLFFEALRCKGIDCKNSLPQAGFFLISDAKNTIFVKGIQHFKSTTFKTFKIYIFKNSNLQQKNDCSIFKKSIFHFSRNSKNRFFMFQEIDFLFLQNFKNSIVQFSKNSFSHIFSRSHRDHSILNCLYEPF